MINQYFLYIQKYLEYFLINIFYHPDLKRKPDISSVFYESFKPFWLLEFQMRFNTAKNIL